MPRNAAELAQQMREGLWFRLGIGFVSADLNILFRIGACGEIRWIFPAQRFWWNPLLNWRVWIAARSCPLYSHPLPA